jgi:hypothetical protein
VFSRLLDGVETVRQLRRSAPQAQR